MASTRRLAAILAADVAGYSRLMGTDEEGTHERLKAHFRELVDPKIAEHRGRTVKNTGDGLLAEFSSVVDAVRCAVEVQRGMADREPEVPAEQRIRFRIGVNLGDVIVEEHDIFGDGVNVAARLEALAEPGGICISRMVRDQIRDKLPYQFEDMGEQSVKNIARPVRVYALRPEAVADLPSGKAAPAAPISQPAVAPRLSIVVLPFANLSRDPELDHFVDGLTEDLTTELSRLPGFFVIARSTAFTFKGQAVHVKQVACELGVRYVLEGSVRKVGQRVRVTVQLIDAETAAHLWADRFDRDLSDILDLQDAIALELASVLDVTLVKAESHRSERSSHPDAVDLTMRARAIFNLGASLENSTAAARLYEQALRVAPDELQALTGLAVALAGKVANRWSDAPEEDLSRAETLAARALALDPRDARCQYAVGLVRRLQRRFDQAITHLEAAIRLNPNMHAAHIQLGWAKFFSGQGEEALPHFADFMRLSPRDPRLFLGYFGFGWVRFMLGDDAGAIEVLHEAIALSPNYSPAHLCLVAAHSMCGRVEDARAALAAYLRTGTRTGTIALVRANRQSTHRGYLAQCERLYEGLRKAGMPEE
jgi:TolB-like protein/cytochrome c-type biogenesis protein CcmH/NrfG